MKKAKLLCIRLGAALLTVCLLLGMLPPASAASATAHDPVAANGKIFYVAPNGSDTNPGSFARPFATLETAMNAMNPGDLLYVRGGVYKSAGTGSGIKSKNGAVEKWFTVLNYPGETPVFDGEWGYGSGKGFGIWLLNSSYWHIEGLEICNYQETGAYLDDTTHHIEFVNMSFHDITDYTTPNTSYGRSGITSAADDCLVDGCEFYNIGTNRELGDMHDHGIYITGKGARWIVRNSYFHDLPAGSGVQIYGGSGDKSGSVIENNLFVRTRLGIVLGGEQCYNTEVRYNTFWHDTKCDLFPTEGAHDNNIHHNVFGPMIPDPAEIVGYHINFPQLCCLYNDIDYNFYDDSADSNSVYPVKIENWVNGNTFNQKVTWDVLRAPAENVKYEEVYDGSSAQISGLGMEAHGQTGAIRFADPENGDFSFADDTQCTLASVGMSNGRWQQVARATADPIFLLENAGFENGLTGWNPVNGWETPITAEVIDAEAYSGIHALKVTQNSTGNGMLEAVQSYEEKVLVQDGHRYEISLKLKNMLENGTVTIYGYEDNKREVTIAADSVADGSWKTLSGIYTPTAGTKFVRIWLLFSGSGVCYIDDVNISDMATVPTETPSKPNLTIYDSLAANPSFESDLSGSWDQLMTWGSVATGATVERSNSDAVTGNWSLHIQNVAGNKTGIGSNWRTRVEENTEYTLQIKVKTSADTPSDSRVFLVVDETRDNNTQGGFTRYRPVGDALTGAHTDWTTHSVTFTTAAEAARLSLCIFAEGAGEFFIDDVLLIKSGSGTITEPTEEYDSLIHNASFEDCSGTTPTGWTFSPGSWRDDKTAPEAQITVDKEVASHGSNSVKIENPGEGSVAVIDNGEPGVPVEQNSIYRFSAKVKSENMGQFIRIPGESAVDARVKFCLFLYGSSGELLRTVDSSVLSGNTDGWGTLSMGLSIADSSVKSVRTFIIVYGKGTVHLDEVKMEKAGTIASSMAPNPSFEDGLTGWEFGNWSDSTVVPQYEVTSADASNGLSSLHITHTEQAQTTNMNTNFVIPVQGGKTYLLRAFVKTGTNNASDSFAAFYLREAAGNTDGKSDFAGTRITGVNTEWMPIFAEFTPAETTNRLNLGLYFKGQGEIWFDDVQMVEYTPVSSLAKNPGFEAGLNNWAVQGGWGASGSTAGLGVIDETVSYSGLRSLRITNPDAGTKTVFNNYYPNDPISAVNGDILKVSAKVRTDAENASDSSVYFHIRSYNGNSDPIATGNERLSGPQNGWDTLTSYFTVTDASNGSVAIYPAFEGKGTVWFDEIVVEKVGEDLTAFKNECEKSLTDKLANRNDYEETEQNALEELVNAGIAAIRSASTRDEMEQARDHALSEIAKLKTKANAEAEREEAAKKLQAAKDAAKDRIDQMTTPEDYREPVSTEVKKMLVGAKRLIDTAQDEARIEEIVNWLDTLVKQLKTNAELTAEELAAAKEAAKNTLRAAGAENTLPSAEQIVEDGLAAIDAAGDQAAVAAALADALDRLAALRESQIDIPAILPAIIGTSGKQLPFKDVGKGDWFYEEVKYVYEKSIMNGTGKDTFSPNSTLTRAMIVTILYRMEAEPDVRYSGKFSDVADGRWYSAAVEWAAMHGIVNGYTSGRFEPDDAVTREQLAAILYRYASKMKGFDVNASTSLNGYADGAKVSDYAQTAVKWALARNLLLPVNGALEAGTSATRAEVAVAVARFLKAYLR